MENEIKIKINDFEGPLDLLLHLVNQYEMDIFEVPLVPVIEQYLAYIRAMERLELEIASEYMVMASQLMLIKSRRLLPSVVENFEENTEQLEYDLLNQIDEYRKYKALSVDLSELHDERSQFFSKSKMEIITDETVLLKDKSLIDLFLSFSKILSDYQQKSKDANTTIQGEKFSISDKIIELNHYFTEQKICKFAQLFSSHTSKAEVLTTFLAILELIKNQQIIFSQADLFSEIILERKAEEV